MGQQPPVYCLGKCYDSPSSGDTSEAPTIQILSRVGIVLEGVADGSIKDFISYRKSGGYSALQKALQMSSDEVVGEGVTPID